MPRNRRTDKVTSIPEPEIVIDLTQDSPSTNTRQNVRARQRDHSIIFVGSEPPSTNNRSNETITVEDDNACGNSEPSLPSTLESPETNGKKSRLITCPICFEPLASAMRPMTTPCGHIYCYGCLEVVIKTQKKCSLCQRNITLAKCVRLHL